MATRSPAAASRPLSSDRTAAYALLLPGLLVVALVTVFPILYAIRMSFSTISLSLNGYTMRFSGWTNYLIVFHASQFWYSLAFTAVYTVITVAAEFVLGLGLALLIRRTTRARGTLMALMLIPWSLITVISAQMWSYMYNGSYGILDYLLIRLGLTHTNVVWLGTPTLAIVSLMVADVWKTTPFMALILLAGLMMIPSELYEAAQIDGATGAAAFFRITLPLLRQSILLSLLFRVLQAFGVFDLPFVLTQGGPGTSTQSITMLAWQAMFRDFNFGPGAAVAVLTVLVVFLLSLLLIRSFRARMSGVEEFPG